MNKTIQELDQITLANDDLFPIWDTSVGDTKKGSVSDVKSKIIGTVDTSPNPTSQNLINSQAVANAVSYCHSSNTVVNGSPLFNGCVVKIMFTENITGSDITTPLTITYNGTPIAVKVNKNGTLADLTANQVELPDANNNLRNLEKSENEEETKKAEEETENVVQTRSIKSGGSESLRTTTAYLYCQAYTTLELLYNGTNFIVFGNPVVISNADYTIYTDGSKVNKKSQNYDLIITNPVIRGGGVIYYKTGNVITIQFDRINTSDVATQGSVEVGTIPEGFRPNSNYREVAAGVVCGTTSGQRQKFSVTVSKTGVITLYNDYGNLDDTNFYATGSISYTTDL